MQIKYLRDRSLSLLIIVCIIYGNFIIPCKSAPVIWTSYTDYRIGQQSIYDNPFLAVNATSTVTINFPTSLTTISTKPAIFFSGFQNYLHVQLYFDININQTTASFMIIKVSVGLYTFLKKLNVNYFVCQNTVDLFVFPFSKGTTTKINTGLREEYYNQTITGFTASDVKHVFYALSGIKMLNQQGTLNVFNLTTIADGTLIKHTVSTDQKNALHWLRISTLIFLNNALKPIELSEYMFSSVITDSKGFQKFDNISASGFFTLTNQLLFGVTGFKFELKDSRIFTLDTIDKLNYRENLLTSVHNTYTNINVFVAGLFDCLTDSYYYDMFQCTTTCTGIFKDSTPNICYQCQPICSTCSIGPSICDSCNVTGQFRVQSPDNVSLTRTCVCNPNLYVDIGNFICELCSSFIQGCANCTTPDSCDTCSTGLLRVANINNASLFVCECTNGLYLVSGICLDYPGCLQANTIITGMHCLNCSQQRNFELVPSLNNKCQCKYGYNYSSVTDSCLDNCGDNITADGVGKCDDGNKIGGDGCSSSCFQEYGFICTQGIPGGKSVCAVKQQIGIQYLYVQKTLQSNQAILVFALTPKQPFLTAETFQNNYLTNIPNVGKKTRFDPTRSFIYLTIQYNQTLEDKKYDVKFTFIGLTISSPDISLNNKLNGINAKLQISNNPGQTTLVVYVAMAVSGLALLIAIIASFLGQKLMGMQLIFPIQASFFIISSFPKQVLSPISALSNLKYSAGYNSLFPFNYQTNYVLSPKLNILRYAGQYIQNYNAMFLLLLIILVIIGVAYLKIFLLGNQQKRIQDLQRKVQDDRLEQEHKNNNKDKQNQGQQSTNQSQKQALPSPQILDEEIQTTRQNVQNWKSCLNMFFDRLFSILILTAMMKVFFCFFLQVSNLTFTQENKENSLNGAFCFISYVTIIMGLYAILYDYKAQKIILFSCNKGKYAMFYILNYFIFIIILGLIYQASFAIYIVAIFSIIPIILIPYQIPYGFNRFFEFQTIIALILQLPFLISLTLGVILTFSKGQGVEQSLCFMFAYVLLGSCAFSIILTIVRMAKIIDFKKLTFFQFSDRRKDSRNKKNNKNKIKLLDLGQQNNWDQKSQDSVRQMIFERNKAKDLEQIDGQDNYIKNKLGNQNGGNKQRQIKQQQQIEDQDQQIDQLERIKFKLRKQLKQKKVMGKFK